MARRVNWRRIPEYTGGAWTESGGACTANVFSYYASVACNHCGNPVCTQVCPTTAMTVRDDKTVFVDDAKCVGCRY